MSQSENINHHSPEKSESRIAVWQILSKPPVLRRIIKDKSVGFALYAFAVSRAIVFAVFFLAAHLTFPESPKPLGELQNPSIPLRRSPIRERFEPLMGRGDASWYNSIARYGYERAPFETTRQHNWAFFPLHPLLWRAAGAVTGELALTGALLVNVLFFVALIFLHKLVLIYNYAKPDADRAVFYAAIFPTSYFYSVPMTESLFLLLTVASFYAAKKEKWLMAGVLGALAGATRSVGVILLPTLIILAWQMYGKNWREYRKTIGLLLIPGGLLAFMIYLREITGNAFAFKDVLVVWERQPTFFLTPLWRYALSFFRYAATSWSFDLFNFVTPIFGLICGALLVQKREWALAFFTLACVIVPLTSGTLHSQTRYVMVVFPIYFLLAIAGRKPLVNQTIQAAFVCFLSVLSAFFVFYFTFAATCEINRKIRGQYNSGVV